MVDIAQRMRAAAQHHASYGFDEIVELLEEAATLIELQRSTIASWEARAAIARGSMAHEPPACSDSVVITPGEVSTPR